MKITNKIIHDNITYKNYSTKLIMDGFEESKKYEINCNDVKIKFKNRPNEIDLTGENEIVLKSKISYLILLFLIVSVTILFLLSLILNRTFLEKTILIGVQVSLMLISTEIVKRNKDIKVIEC